MIDRRALAPAWVRAGGCKESISLTNLLLIQTGENSTKSTSTLQRALLPSSNPQPAIHVGGFLSRANPLWATCQRHGAGAGRACLMFPLARYRLASWRAGRVDDPPRQPIKPLPLATSAATHRPMMACVLSIDFSILHFDMDDGRKHCMTCSYR